MNLLKEKCIMGRDKNKKDMVFCIIYCTDATPYEHYDYFLKSSNEDTKAKANMKLPMVLMQMRWDGKIGFPGGNVESHHESLIEAIKDELKEELNVFHVNSDNLEPLATFADEKKHISSFVYKVTYEELKNIQKNSAKAKHFYSENCGTVLCQLHEKSIPNLLEHKFSGTAKDEFELFLKHIKC